MLEQVRDSKIDCIVVKDFSRFARDYIELGSYLEQIFPFPGVRFISINDNYDSKSYQGSIADININFKNLLYDLYSKDLSQKVRSAVAIRKEQGQYLFSISPFGYRKNPKENWLVTYDHHEPIIEKEVFEKVQQKRGRKATPQYRPTHPLAGKTVCGCCGKNLQHRKRDNH